MLLDIAITALVAALALLALHWLPWPLLLGHELPRPAAYVLGTLAMILPLTGLFAVWGLPNTILALWAVVSFSGTAVLGAIMFDAWLHNRQVRKEAEEREKVLLKEIEP